MQEGKILAKDFIEAEKIVADLNRIDTQLGALLATVSKISSNTSKIGSQGEGASSVSKIAQEESKLNILLKEKATINKNLLKQQAKRTQLGREQTQSLAKQRLENQQLTREQKKQLELQSKYTTELRKAKIIRDGLAKIIQDLQVKQRLGNKLTKEEVALLKKSTKEHKKYKSAIQGAEQSVGNFTGSVGKYQNAMKSVIGVAKGFVAAFGIYSGIQVVKDIFNQIKQIESLNLALSKVTKSQSEFNQTLIYLDDIADFTGVEIISLTDSYKRFRGSIEGSTTSITDAQRIFERFTKASAILGSSTEETNGVLRALGQILSKGKVQAEELRGQLGDRLSGAFGLMAQAIGVTTAELDKMIEQGEVTSDTLIKLAEQVGNTFGVDTVDQIDTTNAAIGRVKNAWIGLLKSVEDGQGVISGVFKGFLNGVANLIKGLTEVNTTATEKGVNAATKIVSEFKSGTENITGDTKEFIVKTLQEADKNLDILYKRLDDLKERGVFLEFKNGELVGDLDALKEVNEAIEKEKATRTELSKILIDEQRTKEALVVSTAEMAKQVNSEINLENKIIAFRKLSTKQLQEYSAAYKEKLRVEKSGLGSGKEGGKASTKEGTIAYYEAKIKAEEKIQKTELTTQESIQKSIDKIKEYEKAISKLYKGDGENKVEGASSNGITGTGDTSISSVDITDGLNVAAYQADRDSFIANEIFKRTEADKTADHIAETFRGVFSEFENLYGLDASAFTDLFDSKENTVSDYGSAFTELNEFIYALNSEKYQEDYARQKAILDKTLNDDKASKKQKSLAQKKFDKEEAKIKKKQFEADKKASLINIAIATAVGVTKALPNFFLSAAVLAAGLAQGIIVANKKAPEFYKGTENAPQGWAWTDEKGAEIHTDKKGNIKDFGSNKGARMKWLEQGDKIYTAKETQDIFNKDLTQNIYRQAMYSGHKKRVEHQKNKDLTNYKLINEVVQLRSEVRGLSNRPIHVENTIIQETPIIKY